MGISEKDYEMNSNAYRCQYIEESKEYIRILRNELTDLVTRQKREPNPYRKTQIAREISITKSEITANLEEIRVTKEIMANNIESEVLIGLPDYNAV